MSETPPENEPSEPAAAPETKHDVVFPMPGAPITVNADWHNAPGTGNYESPPVEPVTAYEKGDDGELVAKVLTPPARPQPTRGRSASTAKKKGAKDEDEDAGDLDDPNAVA
jgi:hypothetical protein